MKRNHNNFRRLLAFLLCVMLMISNLGLTSFADESAVEYADYLMSDLPSDEEMIIVEGPEDLPDVNAGEEYQQEGPSTPIEILAAEGGLFSEPESAPFEQVYTIGDVNITVAADTGVFPEDAALYVDGIEDEEIAHASEDALGISESDTVLIHHSLYSFSGTEIYGPADVKMEPAGYSAVREAYPNAGIDFHMMCWDGECRNAQEIIFDFDKEQDLAEFATSVLTVYDLVAVIRLSEQEEFQETVMQPETVRTGQPLEYRTGQSGVSQTEETVEQSGEGQTEESTEQLPEIQTESFTDQLREMQTEGFAELFAEMQTEGFTEPFTETRTEGFMDLFEETQTGEPAEQPTETQTGEPAEQPAETRIGEPAEQLTQIQTGEPAKQLTESQTEKFTEAPDDEETETEALAESMQFSPAFEESRTVGDVTITVKADPGVFPEGTVLSIERVTALQQHQADAAVDEMRDEGVNVAASETYDIKAIDSVTGKEYQPGEGQTVNISFALSQVADENLETQVYHVKEDEATGELTAESLEVNTEEIPQSGGELAAVVETDGFSLYTVEFTYSNLEYVLPGDTSAPLSEVLTSVGLTGEVTAVQVSNNSLISASNETGEWIVTAHQAFDTTEWMKVTINGVVFEIKVTDDQTVTANSTTWTGTMVVSNDVTIESRVRVDGDVTLVLNEGTKLNAPKGIYVYTGQRLTIEGSGTLIAGDEESMKQSSSHGLAGIGGGWEVNDQTNSSTECGTIIIKGGTVNATGGECAAGIGGGYSGNGGSITIQGNANVTASSQIWGAGIGGGYNGHAGTITIRDNAVVNATSSYAGAGIGGGGFESASTEESGGTVTIEGGTVTAMGTDGTSHGYGAGIGSGWMGSIVTVTINGGTVNATGGEWAAGIGGGYKREGKVQINGGAVTATAGKFGAAIGGGGGANGGEITIKGGTVTAEAKASSGSDTTTRGAAIGGGGRINTGDITDPVYVGGSGGKISIEGGTVTAVNDFSSAAIGGAAFADGGEITISGNAKVTATGGWRAAAIGGGFEGGSGTIKISGGEVTAIASAYGPGIGIGEDGSGGTIEITGGMVTAKGNWQSAAIGGGNNSDGGTIKISDGEVKAEGGADGAGIGGGSGRGGGTIEISGGKVDASTLIASNARAAAIGGGYQGSGGTIKISGGTVKAVSGWKAAGIGGGYKGAGGSIEISGGTTDASNGRELSLVGGIGIGCGYEGTPGTVNIVGGVVRANGYNAGIAGTTTLSYMPSTRDDMSLRSNSFSGTVTIADGHRFTDGNTAYNEGLHSGPQLANKTLVPWDGLEVRIDEGLQGRISVNRRYVNDGNTVPVTVRQNDGWILEKLTYKPDNGETQVIPISGGGGSFTMPAQSVTVSAEGGYYFGNIQNPADIDVPETGTVLPVQWTVTVNPDCDRALNGMKLSAVIAEDSRDYITMDAGTGLNVSYRNKDSEVESATISWDSLTEHTPASWSYDLGQCQSSVSKPQEVFTFKTNIRTDQVLQGDRSVVVKVVFSVLDTESRVRATTTLSCKLINKIYKKITISNAGSGTVTASVESALIDQAVTLYASPANEYVLTGLSYTESGETNSIAIDYTTGDNNVSVGSFSMPARDVTVHATFKKRSDSVMYLDEKGGSKYALPMALTDQTTTLSGWYYVKDTVALDSRISVSGEAHLILCDGAVLHAHKGIQVSGNDSLTIYAQSTDGSVGALVIDAVEDNYAGIGGGDLAGTEGSDSGGIITIIGGAVTAAGKNGAGIGGGKSGNGGTVIIKGGMITAKSSSGSAIGAGCSGNDNGSLTIANGMKVAAGNSSDRMIIQLYDDRVPACHDNTYAEITPCSLDSHICDDSLSYCVLCKTEGLFRSINITENVYGSIFPSINGMDCNGAMENQTVTLTVFPVSDYVLTGLSYIKDGESEPVAIDYVPVIDGELIFVGSFIMPDHNVTVQGTFTQKSASVMYLNAKGQRQYASATKLTNQTSISGWYYVENKVEINSRISVSGEAHLILCDDAVLYAHQGIRVSGSNSLTIYAQSTDSSVGALTIDNEEFAYAGIGNDYDSLDGNQGGRITINGGRIIAKGGQSAAGIGGSIEVEEPVTRPCVIIINGGVITAVGGLYAAGIGGGDGVLAGEITISGGRVTAIGGGWASGIGRGYGGSGGSLTMSLSKDDEYITASSYAASVSVAGEAALKDLETGTIYEGVINNTADIAGRTLVLSSSSLHLIKVEAIEHGKVTAPNMAKEGETVALDVIPDEGYALKELNVKQGDTSVDVDENNQFIMPAGNVTVGAVFTEACTISFSAGNGGSGEIPSIAAGTGASFILPGAAAFTAPDGMTFKEWSVKIGDADPVIKNPGDQITVSANTTVTATWVHVHSFMYSADGGAITASCTAANCTLTGSKAALKIKAPAKTVYGDGKSAVATLEGLDGFNTATGLTVKAEDIQYTGTGSTSYNNSIAPSDSGTYKAAVTLTGVRTSEGENKMVTASVDYTIAPKPVRITSATATERAYAENDKSVEISSVVFDGAGQTELTQDQDYTVAGEMQDDTAGDSKGVTVTVTLLNPNYSLAENTAATTVKINRISYTGTKTAAGTVWSHQDTANAELTLPALPAGAVYAATGTVSATAPSTPALISGTPSVSGTTLTYSTTSKPKGTSAQITVPVTGATNYHDYDVVVTITAEDKTDAGVAITGGDHAVAYGDTGVVLSGTVADAGENGAWNWSSGDESIVEIGSTTGAVTIRKTGSVTITAGYESDSTIGTAAITLTVNPASVPIPTAASGLKWTGRELTGVPEGVGYTVADGKKTDVGAYTATASLSSKTNYRWSDNTTEDKRIAWNISKADGPAAPSGLTGIAPTSDGGSDGRITGVTVRMEYSAKKDFSDRRNCTGTEITGLPAGSYYVRVKETGTQKAGKYASVSVPAYAAPTYAVTVKNGTGSGSYAAGVSVTIKANTPSDGKRFKKWTGADGLTFTSGSASSAAASFRMPAKAVTITATYEDAAKEGDSSSKPSGKDKSENNSGFSDKAKEPSEDPSKSSDKATGTAKILLNAGFKVTWSKKNKIIVKIGEVPGATSYDIYAAYCGKNSWKKIKTVKSGDITITKLNGKKLNKKKSVKIKVIAKQGDTIIARSITAHVAGPKNEYSYVKRIKLPKKTYKLKKGKTAKIKAKLVLSDKRKKGIPSGHVSKLRYASSNKKVATVTKKGKIKARGKGTCLIYVYAANGMTKTVKVVVK